ncbi:MAG: Dabb family protein [Paludibacter sp.]|jgi:hypothetical protein|nr:Dabb family protein [Paludibacter sp.]
MIKHIVFFSVCDSFEGMNKIEICRKMKQDLEGLKSLIPQLQAIEVGMNHAEAPSGNYDIALYSEFETMADLDAYQVHPEHKRVAAFIGKVKTARTCVDYEV